MKDEYEDDIKYMSLSDEAYTTSEVEQFLEGEELFLDDGRYDELDLENPSVYRTEKNFEHLRNRWRKKKEP